MLFRERIMWRLAMVAGPLISFSMTQKTLSFMWRRNSVIAAILTTNVTTAVEKIKICATSHLGNVCIASAEKMNINAS